MCTIKFYFSLTFLRYLSVLSEGVVFSCDEKYDRINFGCNIQSVYAIIDLYLVPVYQ